MKSRQDFCNRCGFETTLRHRFDEAFRSGGSGVTRETSEAGRMAADAGGRRRRDEGFGRSCETRRTRRHQCDCPDLPSGTCGASAPPPGERSHARKGAAIDGCRFARTAGMVEADSPYKGFGRWTGGSDDAASTSPMDIGKRSAPPLPEKQSPKSNARHCAREWGPGAISGLICVCSPARARRSPAARTAGPCARS